MDWFKSYPADYRDDTWHLTLAEHGAYKLLIDHYMHHEKPLPDNDNALASIVGVDPKTWATVSANVRVFFTPKKGKLVHKRCEAELNCSFDKRKDGKKRASKYRKSLNTVTRDERVSNAPRGEERRGEESIKKEDTNVSPKDDFDYDNFVDIWNSSILKTSISKCQKLSPARKTAIRARMKDTFENNIDFWQQACDKIVNSSFLTGNNRNNFMASFDWVLNPKNIIKILEGNYDDKPINPNQPTQPNNNGQPFGAVATRNKILSELEDEQGM